MADFKEGDTVKLKSGGPLMTVAGYQGPSVECHWFHVVNGEWTHKFASFLGSMLKAFPAV